MKIFYWYDKVFIFAGLALFIVPALLKVLGYSFIKPFFVPCCVMGSVLLGIELLFFILFVFLAYLNARVKDE